LIAGTLNNMDEAGLVSYCKNNIAAAQKILYVRYAEDMMLFCLRYIPQHEDAKEVLMDSFLSFFKNMGSFTYRGEGSVKAWLKKIVLNQCLSYLRKRNPVFIAAKEGQYEDITDSVSVLDHLNAKEIMQMIHALPDGYRMVFNLYVFEEMNHKEIGDVLGITESTSKSQLHRARALLKEKILQTG
jgi:RNA polymerase sigma-70 factor (ECF subfamily)